MNAAAGNLEADGPGDLHRRILLVDDMPSIHEDFRKILVDGPLAATGGGALDEFEAALFESPAPARVQGFRLDSAFQGQEALERVRSALHGERPYSLAFIDMRMPPGWDGVETIEQLWKVDPDLQVVICTAYSDYAWEDVLSRLEAHQRLMVLKKPFDAIEVSQLAHTLTAKWLGARQVARHTSVLEGEVQRRTAALQVANVRLRDELAERERREAELRMAASVFANAPSGIVVTDERSRIVSVNPAFTSITGYRPDEVTGRKLAMLRAEHEDPNHYRTQWRKLIEEGHWSGELWSRRKDGELFCELLNFARVEAAAGEAARYVGVFIDITGQRRLDERLRHMACHDALTGLANRARLRERVNLAVDAARAEGTGVGLMLLDLDHLKPVNDTMGHDAGDVMLQAVAERLARQVRRGDMAARLGGDEFVLMLNGIADATGLELAAERLLASMSGPVWLDGQALQVGATIGVACGPADGANFDELVKRATLALHAAKAAGRPHMRLADADLADNALLQPLG